MDKEKIERLKRYASAQGYNILEEETDYLRNAISDSTITIRLPNELKQLLKQQAAEKHIPYQRYVKTILINAVKKSS